jgi:hypothetical protein
MHTTDALKKVSRLRRFNLKAWIGYNSFDEYRIWNPVMSKAILTRDVTANEEALKHDMVHIKLTI